MTEIEIHRYSKGDVNKLAGCEANSEAAFMNGECFTGITKDRTYVFCAGIALYWPGHGEAWAIIAKPEEKYPAAYGKIKELIEWGIKEFHLFRMSAHCETDSQSANNLIQHLGFSYEATLRSYGPQREAYNIYGRVIDG